MPPRRSVRSSPNLSLFVRANERVNTSPPPRRTPIECEDDPTTVVVVLGKAPWGKTSQYSFKVDVTAYMDKQQREQIDSTTVADGEAAVR
jgi:hypothetical protein